MLIVLFCFVFGRESLVNKSNDKNYQGTGILTYDFYVGHKFPR
jgi:hypothetical protein